jgi:hypothetical protein
MTGVGAHLRPPQLAPFSGPPPPPRCNVRMRYATSRSPSLAPQLAPYLLHWFFRRGAVLALVS